MLKTFFYYGYNCIFYSKTKGKLHNNKTDVLVYFYIKDSALAGCLRLWDAKHLQHFSELIAILIL